jgi:hypothetical protein
MNIALALGQDNKAMLVYDQPFEFIPAWIESAADGRGVRIIGEEGQEYVAGLPDSKIISELERLRDVLMVRMKDNRPIEAFTVSFITQKYEAMAGAR